MKLVPTTGLRLIALGCLGLWLGGGIAEQLVLRGGELYWYSFVSPPYRMPYEAEAALTIRVQGHSLGLIAGLLVEGLIRVRPGLRIRRLLGAIPQSPMVRPRYLALCCLGALSGFYVSLVILYSTQDVWYGVPFYDELDANILKSLGLTLGAALGWCADISFEIVSMRKHVARREESEDANA